MDTKEIIRELRTKNGLSQDELAEKLRVAFETAEIPVAGRQTISLGTARAKDGESSDSLCMRVDNALYKAKRTGKNKVVSADK